MKRKLRYNKLVRDKIPEKIVASGCSFKARKIEDNEEFINAVASKVVEEAKELAAAFLQFEHAIMAKTGDYTHEYYALANEFADLYDVLQIIEKTRCSVHEEDIEDARRQKNLDNGSFSEKYFLEWVKK